jgi:hypothetical protein
VQNTNLGEQPLRATDNLTVRWASDNATIEHFYYIAANHCSMTAPYARYYELALNSHQGCSERCAALL